MKTKKKSRVRFLRANRNLGIGPKQAEAQVIRGFSRAMKTAGSRPKMRTFALAVLAQIAALSRIPKPGTEDANDVNSVVTRWRATRKLIEGRIAIGTEAQDLLDDVDNPTEAQRNYAQPLIDRAESLRNLFPGLASFEFSDGDAEVKRVTTAEENAELLALFGKRDSRLAKDSLTEEIDHSADYSEAVEDEDEDEDEDENG